MHRALVFIGRKMASTPSIRISQHQRYHSPLTYAPFSATTPIAVPRVQEPVPPPLPPPSHIHELTASHDPGWQWGNDPSGSEFGRAAPVKPGSSLLGTTMTGIRPEGQRREFYIQHAGTGRRQSSLSTVTLLRETEMMDANGDDDASMSRRTSNYRYAAGLDMPL